MKNKPPKKMTLGQIPNKREDRPFKFKKFEIYQSSGFKISTEACLFGAYVAHNCFGNQVLDIGTGTGVLSLMYSQKHPSTFISAVEVDLKSYNQALTNFQYSGWNNLRLIHGDINQLAKSIGKFDLIISNPPFFSNHLLGERQINNIAKHQSLLQLDDLVRDFEYLCHENTQIVILLPLHEQKILEKLMTQISFFPYKILNLYTAPGTQQFRKIVMYSKSNNKGITEDLYIYNEKRQYTDAFIALLKDYYIIFDN